MKENIGAHVLICPSEHEKLAADYPMLKSFFRVYSERGQHANVSGKIVAVEELKDSPESHMVVVDVAPNSDIEDDERYIIAFPSEIFEIAGP